MFRPEQFAGTRTNAEQIHNKSLAEDDPRLGDPYYDPRIGNAPRDFLAADDGSCHGNSVRAPGTWDPNCPSTRMISGQYKEHSGVVYDNYLQRVKDENGGSVPGGAAEQADRHRAPRPGGPHRRRRPRGGRRQGGGRYGAAAWP